MYFLGLMRRCSVGSGTSLRRNAVTYPLFSTTVDRSFVRLTVATHRCDTPLLNGAKIHYKDRIREVMRARTPARTTSISGLSSAKRRSTSGGCISIRSTEHTISLHVALPISYSKKRKMSSQKQFDRKQQAY